MALVADRGFRRNLGTGKSLSFVRPSITHAVTKIDYGHTKMNPRMSEAILAEVLSIFPAFQEQWGAQDNYHRNDDGSFTTCRVWSEFSTWFIQTEQEPAPVDFSKLAELVNSCVTSGDNEQRGSVLTCFLENVAGEQRANALKGLLIHPAQAYMSQWEPRS